MVTSANFRIRILEFEVSLFLGIGILELYFSFCNQPYISRINNHVNMIVIYDSTVFQNFLKRNIENKGLMKAADPLLFFVQPAEL